MQRMQTNQRFSDIPALSNIFAEGRVCNIHTLLRGHYLKMNFEDEKMSWRRSGMNCENKCVQQKKA